MQARSRRISGFTQLTLPRGALLGSTALQAAFALAFALPAMAQPAPNARPQGGQVVAGQASIAQSPVATTITQSTDRAAINWQSFDVGAQQRVVFQQPGAGSITLNRVITPRPSEIAGRIEANGSVVIINGAGVVFHRGAQVEAQSFVASTADTTNAAFMAGGRLRLDQPGRPGARIENRGNITVRDTGLAALVAPGVANSGTIRARMGTVVLAGAETHTIDLHGDGLVAFDVTGQVRTAPLGPDGRPTAALVTNEGTVLAEGGTVLLTAQAADGLVQNLVSAGGTVRADTLGARTGQVEIVGIGGSIRVEGTVAAAGTRPGETGGTVVARATGDVALGATARVIASGPAGGGTVAIGTTAARARAQGGGVGAENARRATVAEGARIAADATERGNGGTVAVIGRERVDHAGAITARGGPAGGDGGRVEVSSNGGFGLTGTVDTSAPAGRVGTLLLDPRDLSIVDSAVGEIGTNGAPPQVAAGDGGADTDATLSIGTLKTLLDANLVRLEATRDLIVDKAFTYADTGNSLTLAAGRHVKINQALTLKGDIVLLASDPTISNATVIGEAQIGAALTSTEGAVFIRSFGTSGAGVAFAAGGAATGATRVSVVANAMTLPAAAGKISAPTVELSGNAGTTMKLGPNGAGDLVITSLAGISATNLIRFGAATLPDGTFKVLAGAVQMAGGIKVQTPALELFSTATVTIGQNPFSGGSTVSSLKVVAGDSVIVNGKVNLANDIVLLAADSSLPAPVANGRVQINNDVTSTAGSVTMRSQGASGSVQIKNDDAVEVTASARITVIANSLSMPKANMLEAPLVEISPNAGTAMNVGAGASGGLALADLGFVKQQAGTTIRLGGATQPGDATPTNLAEGLKLTGALALSNVSVDLRSAAGVANSAGALSGVKVLTGVAAKGDFRLEAAAHGATTVGKIEAPDGVIALKLTGDRTFDAALSDNLVTTKGIHVQAAGALSVAGKVERPDEIALTGNTLTVNDGAELRSTLSAVVLRSVPGSAAAFVKIGSTAGGAATVEAATRLTIRSDAFNRNGNTLKTTAPGGVVEQATHTAGVFTVTDLSGTDTATFRLGAATAALSTDVEVTATSIALNATPVAADVFEVLDLRSSGAVTQAAGIDLTGRTLTGEADSFALTSKFNTIPTLGVLKATDGDIAVATQGALTVAGAVSATGAVALGALADPLTTAIVVAGTGSVAGTTVALKAGDGGISLKGGVTQGGTGGTDALALTTTGAVTGEGAVSANRLTGSAESVALGGATPATSEVKIGALGDFETGAGLKIVSKGDMQVTGAVKAAQAADGNLYLAAATVTVAEGAALTAGTATKAGRISLLSDGNVTLKGDLRAFAVGGVEGNISIQAGATGSIAQSAGTVRADATLSMTGAAGITQSGSGILDAATLLGTASAGAIALPNANRLDTLGSLNARDGITLANAIALEVTGPVSVGQSGSGPATLKITSGGAMEVTGALVAGKDGVRAGSIVLTAQDGTLRDGSESLGNLSIKGDGLLDARRVGGAGGDTTLTAARVVEVTGAQAAPDNGRFKVVAEGFALGAGGQLKAGGTDGRIEIRANDIQLGGGADPALLAPAGTVALAPRDDRAIALGDGAGAAFKFKLDSTSFARIKAASLEVGASDSGGISIFGTVAPSVSTLRLNSGGDILAVKAGLIEVGRLEGQAGGAITLDGVGHKVATLGDLAAGGTLRFRAAGALAVAGKVAAGTDLALTATALNVLAGGSVGAGAGGVLTLVADEMSFRGKVSTAGGRIEILPATDGRNITLAGLGDLGLDVDSLAQLSAGTLLLGARDGVAPRAGALTILGDADLTGRVERLRLSLQGTVDDGPAGRLTVSRLGDTALGGTANSGAFVLDTPGHRIGTVDALRVAGQFRIGNAIGLEVAGPVVADGAVLLTGRAASATALAVSGRIESGAGAELRLETTQGGLAVAGTAELAAGGRLVLAGVGGATSVAAGATLTAAADAAISGQDGLVIAGGVQAGTGIVIGAAPGAAPDAFELAAGGSLATKAGNIELGIAGSAALKGSLDAGGGILILKAGSVAGTGAVTAASVTGSAGTLALTGKSNSIAELNALATSAGALDVTSQTALALTNTVVSAGDMTLLAPSVSSKAGSLVKAPGQMTIVTADGIALKGQVIAGTLAGDGGAGAVSATNAANEIAMLGGLKAGTTIDVLSAVALTVAGAVEAQARVALTGTAAGDEALRVAGTGAVRALGAGGDVTLTTTLGGIALAGTLEAPGTLKLDSAGVLKQTGGTAQGGVLTVTALGAATQGAGARLEATASDLTITAASFELAGTLEAARDAFVTASAGAGRLKGSVEARDVVLNTGASLTIESGAGITATRLVTLRSGGGAPVQGKVAADRNIVVDGAVSAGTTLAITADGTAGGGGTLTAATLTGATGGDAAFTGANQLKGLGAFAAGDTFRLTNAQGLTVTGPVSALKLAVLDVAGTLKIEAGAALALNAPTLDLKATAIEQVGGAIATDALNARSGGAITLDQPGNAIRGIGAIEGTDVAIRTTTAVDVNGTIAVGSLKLAAGGDIVQTGGSVTATGEARLGSATRIELKGGTIGAADVVLDADGGEIRQSGGTLGWTKLATLEASGAIVQTGGQLDGGADGELRLSAGTGVSLTNAANVVPKLGTATATAGIALATAGDMRVVGAVNAGAAGALVLDIGGALSLDAVRIEGGTATLNAGLKTTTAGIVQAKGGDLDFAGLVTLDTKGGAAPFRTGAIELNGRLAAGAARLRSGGAVTQGADGVIALKGALELAASGDVVLDGAVSAASAALTTAGLRQAAGGTMAFKGPFDLTAGGNVVLNGSVSATAATLQAVGLSQAAGGTMAFTGPLVLTATGDVVLDGSVSATSATLETVGLRQAAGGTMAFTGPLTIKAGGDVALDGTVSATSAALTTAGLSQAAGGTMAFAGPLTLKAGGDVVLNGAVGGSEATLTTVGLTQGSGGDLAVAGPLTIRASGDARLDGRIRDATTGDLAAAGSLTQAETGQMDFAGALTLKAGGGMTLDGKVRASEIALIVGGDFAQGGNGTIGQPGPALPQLQTLRLAVAGDAIFEGEVHAGTLTHLPDPAGSFLPGAVGGRLKMDTASNRILELRDLRVGTAAATVEAGRLDLVTASALNIEGTLEAPIIRVTSGGLLTFGTVTLRTGGTPFVPRAPGGLPDQRMPDPDRPDSPARIGAVFETAGNEIRISRASLNVEPLASNNATLALRLPERTGGTIDLGNTTGRQADLILDLGLGGRAVGTIDVRNLTVYGGGGGTRLDGSIGGVSGQGAASRAGIGPQLSAEYQINGCPIASVNCVLLIVRLATPANPVQDLGLTAARDEREDPDIFVPNVAERDF